MAQAGLPAFGNGILLCRARHRVCALPLACVSETMRPLAIEPFGARPEFVLGLSRIRGEHVPVVDLGRVLGSTDEGTPTRFVVLRLAGRAVALQVEGVLGVGELGATSARELPPLLKDAAEGPVGLLAARDAELLLVLRAARLVPEARGEGDP